METNYLNWIQFAVIAGMLFLIGGWKRRCLRLEQEKDELREVKSELEGELYSMHSAVVEADNKRNVAEDKALKFQEQMTRHLQFCKAYEVSLRADKIPKDLGEVQYWYTDPEIDFTMADPDTPIPNPAGGQRRVPLRTVRMNLVFSLALRHDAIVEFVAGDVTKRVTAAVLWEWQRQSILWGDKV